MIQTVSATVTKSISPQITKSYACGNYQRCEKLVIAASKRAKETDATQKSYLEETKNYKSIGIALEEIIADKVKIVD